MVHILPCHLKLSVVEAQYLLSSSWLPVWGSEARVRIRVCPGPMGKTLKRIDKENLVPAEPQDWRRWRKH